MYRGKEVPGKNLSSSQYEDYQSGDSIVLADIDKITDIPASDLKKNVSAVRLQIKNEDCR